MTKVRTWAGGTARSSGGGVCGGRGVGGAERATAAREDKRVAAFCARLPARARVAYETGPTGFGLARVLDATGSAVW